MGGRRGGADGVDVEGAVAVFFEQIEHDVAGEYCGIVAVEQRADGGECFGRGFAGGGAQEAG